MANDVLAITVVRDTENVSGRLLERSIQVIFSDDYPAGGYTFPIALATQYGQCGIRTLVGVWEVGTNLFAAPYDVKWDVVHEKLVVLTGGVQVAGGTNLSTLAKGLALRGSR